MNLTQSQQAALALDKNISVTAGAGSGKTRILVERFLRIVMQTPHLTRSVVAITFTEKAAGEMQERIAEEVNARLSAELISAKERKTLQTIRDNLNSAHISTIHGFCMRILREFPIEAGVSPDFAILDPIRQQVLLSNAIKTIFKELDESATNDTIDWLKLFLAIPRRRLSDMLETALQKPHEMEKIVNRFVSFDKDSYLQFLADRWLAIFSESVSQEDIENAIMQVEEILNHDKVPVENKLSKAQEISGVLIEFQKTYHENPASLKTKSLFLTLTEILTTNSDKGYSSLAHIGSKTSWGLAVHKIILQLSSMLAGVRQAVAKMDPGSAPDETDAQWFDIFNIFIELYRRTSTEFTKVKNELGVLDFEDLQIYTVRLLSNNEAIHGKLQKRFRYIMVDEFQDTNALQWEIVQRLVTENGSLSKDQTFVVGDPKQSIYGFRDADIRVFKDVVELFSRQAGSLFSETYNGSIVFRESFRFLPQINAFINHFFSGILQSNPYDPFEVGYENLQAERNVPDGGHIELAVLDEDSKKFNEAEYIAVRIKELMELKKTIWEWQDGQEQKTDLQYGDIAILIRDRSHLFEIEQALRLMDIPFKTVGGIGFWQRQEIYDFYHILKFLANPVDDLALIGILRSRFFMLSDAVMYYLSQETENGYLQRLNGALKHTGYNVADRQNIKRAARLINKWLDSRERMTLAELLNIIVDDTQLFALLNAEFSGEQRTANLQKVIELADNFDQSGPGGLRAFLDTIDDLINREVREGEAFLALEDRTSVKIMTIHVSKGLQFPVVFIPNLNRSLRSGGADIMMDSDLGMAVTFKDEEDFRGERSSENTLYRLLRLRQKQKDLAELKRIFYVAVSRASNFLFLSASCKKSKAAHDSMFELLFNPLNTAGIDPFEAGEHKYKDFNLHIRNDYPVGDNKSHAHESFNSFLLNIEKAYQSDKPLKVKKPIELAAKLPVESAGRIFSATALMTYIKNSKEYYDRYHLGFFEGDYSRLSEKGADNSMDSLKKGKIVHRFLELFQRQQASTDQIFEQVLFEQEIFDIHSRDALKIELKNILTTISTSDIGQSIMNAKNFRNEVALTMMLGNDYFTGTIDRLQQNQDGLWEIIDYKTNKIKDVQLESAGQEYDIQMKSYALLLSRLHPNQEKYRVALYFLAINKYFEHAFSPEEINEIEKYFKNVIDEIKTKFPAVLA